MVSGPFPRRTASIAPAFADREHDDRHTVFAGKRERGRIHDLQIAVEGLLMARCVITLRLRVLLRIGAIDAVDIGGLENGVASHFGGAQHRGGVGGEERIAGAAGEHHDPVLLEMAQRPLPLVGLADLRHGERRHGAGAGAERSRSRPRARGRSSPSPACPWRRRSAATGPCAEILTPRRCCRRRPRRRA